jgi:hypothetical protein
MTKPKYYACEVCGHNHPWAWNGDCRDDANRFTDQQLDTRHGPSGYELAEMWERVEADEPVTPVTPVIFRKMHRPYGGEVIAIFPTDAASYNDYECGCYVHVGQHGTCEPSFIIEHSRAATDAERADLKAELEGAPYGYRFREYNRLQSKWLDVRRDALARIGAKLPPNDDCRVKAVGRLCHEGA